MQSSPAPSTHDPADDNETSNIRSLPTLTRSLNVDHDAPYIQSCAETQPELQLNVQWRRVMLERGEVKRRAVEINNALARQLALASFEIAVKEELIASLRGLPQHVQLEHQVNQLRDEPNVSRSTVCGLQDDNQSLRYQLERVENDRALQIETALIPESSRHIQDKGAYRDKIHNLQLARDTCADDANADAQSRSAQRRELLDTLQRLNESKDTAERQHTKQLQALNDRIQASTTLVADQQALLDAELKDRDKWMYMKEKLAGEIGELEQAVENLQEKKYQTVQQLERATALLNECTAARKRVEQEAASEIADLQPDMELVDKRQSERAYQELRDFGDPLAEKKRRLEDEMVARRAELERMRAALSALAADWQDADVDARGTSEALVTGATQKQTCRSSVMGKEVGTHQLKVGYRTRYNPADAHGIQNVSRGDNRSGRVATPRPPSLNLDGRGKVAMDVDDQGLDLEEHEAPRPSHGAAECPTNLVCSSSIIPGSLRSLTENDKGSVAGTPKGRVASGTPGRRVAAGLNMPKQKLRGVDVADHLTALDQFKLGSPLRTPSPRKRGPRSAKGAHDGQHTPRSRHSPYSREARPSRYGRVGDMGEDCDADDEEVPRRNRERPRSHPTRSRPLRRAKFEDVNDMDDDYDYDDYNDYDDDGNDVEPKTPVSRIARRFLQEKIAPGALYAPQTMKKNFNNLVLGLILRGMGIQLVYHVVALEPVSDEELDAFRRNPRSHGPDLEDLRLDTNGLATTDELSGSAWNQRVAKLLCGKVKEITDRDGGDGRFGVVDADRIKRGVDTRLGRMYRLIASVVPQAGEDVVDAIARFREAHQAYNDQRRVTTSRQTKALARLRYAGVLRTACRVSNKPEALAYWSYVMRAVEALGFEGMSDEETDYEEIEHDSGVVTKRRYHKVLNPVWRRPELRDLFAKVDEAPALARMYFDKRAGAKTPRVRVDEASGQAPPKRIPKALYDPVWLEAQGELVELMLELTDDPFEIFQADAWAEESHMRYPSALNTALSKCRWSKPEEKEGAQSNNGDRTGLTGHLQGTIESSYDLAVLPNRIWRMVDCCLLESEPGVVLVGVSPWTHSPSPQVNCRTAVQDRRPQLGKLENAKDLEEAGRAGLSLRPISLNDSIEDRRQGQEQVHPHLVETGRRTEELAKSIFVEKSDTTFGDERDEDEKPWELKEPVGLLADYLCGEDVFGDAPAPSLRTTSATLRSMSTHAKDKDPSRLGPRSSLIKELLHRVEAFGAWPDHEEEELHLQPHPQRARSLRDEYIEVLTPRFVSPRLRVTTECCRSPYGGRGACWQIVRHDSAKRSRRATASIVQHIQERRRPYHSVKAGTSPYTRQGYAVLNRCRHSRLLPSVRYGWVLNNLHVLSAEEWCLDEVRNCLGDIIFLLNAPTIIAMISTHRGRDGLKARLVRLAWGLYTFRRINKLVIVHLKILSANPLRASGVIGMTIALRKPLMQARSLQHDAHSRSSQVPGVTEGSSLGPTDQSSDILEDNRLAVEEAGHDLAAATVLQIGEVPRSIRGYAMAGFKDRSTTSQQHPSTSQVEARDRSPWTSFLTDARSRNKATEKARIAAESVETALRQCERMLRAIKPHDTRNFIAATMSSVEDVVLNQREKLQKITRPEATEAVGRAVDVLEVVESLLEAHRLLYPDMTPLRVDNAHLRMEAFDDLQPATLVAHCLALTSRIFHGCSREGANIILRLTKLFGHSLVFLGDGPNILQRRALRDTPIDVRTVEKRVNLGIRTIPFAVCPSCRCTYEPSYVPPSSKPLYPAICREDTGDEAETETLCGTGLVDETGSPKEIFEYYPFFDWFGRFIALPGIESLGDRFCERIDKQQAIPAEKRGVEDGSLIRSLPAPGGNGRLFVAHRGSEKRWLFALHVDFFNAEGNRLRGRTASTGHIVMTCLNLPLHMRNDDAYKYLAGVIRGPHEPSAKEGQIRHYIRPLIQDMKLTYTRGVRFRYSGCSELHRASEDLAYRHIHRMVIAAFIADSKAARPGGGQLDVTSHHFCHICRCWILAHLGRVDFENWVKISDVILRAAAKLWKAAPRSERKAIEEQYAARDSEFWEFDYWAPTRQIVVDPMHTWFLIVLQRFFREAMCLDSSPKNSFLQRRPAFFYDFTPPPPLSPPPPSSSSAATAAPPPPSTPAPPSEATPAPTSNESTEDASYRTAVQTGLIHRYLVAPIEDGGEGKLAKKLQGQNMSALVRVCLDVQKETRKSKSEIQSMSKQDLIEVLVAWRMTKPFAALPWTVIPYDPTINMIRRVIREVSVPTWLKDKPPLDLGEASAGTLKANQWRWLYRLYVPLALIHMWHPNSPYAIPSAHDMKPILDMNMQLTSNTILVVKHSVTDADQAMFREQLRDHILGLRRHFPGFIFPGYHLAFHIPDFMSLLGPARNWWCFPFERLAGKLQRIPKSHKIGQSEHTMLHSFVKGSIFRQWLLRPDVPPILKYCRSLVDKAYRFVGAKWSENATVDDDAEHADDADDLSDVDDDEDVADEVFGDFDANESRPNDDPLVVRRSHTNVPRDLRDLVGAASIACYKRAFAPKGYYSTQGSNRHICVRSTRPDRAAQGSLRFAVQYARVLPDSHLDAFARYWNMGFEAIRTSSQYKNTMGIIEPRQVVGQAARWDLGDGSAVYVNLSDTCQGDGSEIAVLMIAR
ncbi:uncharacterized protein SCHCODRAFT_02495587 [Schizophyllum commune H4-8]|uniref:Uncharacterized protein n=1 Tax=Schizophyllum commune (strain H4-8 / FGSC 9210) TaxID=578458 RepID=D8Q2D4_SCHCM|nr:uncharacterized protein SCHCODRAFT_02495587 [Schizophyllum commune H4-8]KAI5895820.1 hypothetical protein SCHCODRAFT_02495587 [Schizophyllum commune H4-8]